MDDLWQHQREAIEWADARPHAILHHEPGCGKTRTALELIRRDILRRGGHGIILVCCPKSVIPAWRKQVNLWLPNLRVLCLTKGTSKQKCQQLSTALANPEPLLVVVNYETAWRMAALEKTAWTHLVWDEMHRLKAPSGAASRWAGRMCRKHTGARRLGLTGTLIPNSVLDLWGQFRAIEPDLATFGQSYVMHRANFAVMGGGMGQKFVVGFKNLEQAHRKLLETTHHRKSADVLDLPPIRFFDVPCDLSPQEAKLYLEVERDFCAKVEAGDITPKNALEHLLRLQQICGGAVKYDGEPVARRICADPGKAAVLADMLEDSPVEPVVVFCLRTADISLATETLVAAGRTVSELSGRANDLEGWQQGKTTALVVQIQAGGVGVDLSRASSAYFWSLGFSLSDYSQAIARLHRPGQEHAVSIWHLLATVEGHSTVDGRVYQVIRKKGDLVNDILRGYGARAPAGAV